MRIQCKSSLLIFLLLCFVGFSCIWDDDTLEQELRGLNDVTAVILGNFPRNPPLYYEMRITRLKKLLRTTPNDLNALDGISVAYDRIGKSDSALVWIMKKEQALKAINYNPKDHKQPNHLYRYYANRGTFHIHKWLKDVPNRKDLTEIKTGRVFIAKAIEENPDAHFGREKYQLMAVDWIITNYENSKRDTSQYFPSIVSSFDDENKHRAMLRPAVKGFTGLIAQGNAWNSFDIFYALSTALSKSGSPHAAYFARERCLELIDEGKGSILPNSPKGNKLKRSLKTITLRENADDPTKVVRETKIYKSNRQRVKKWHKAREEYLLKRLQDGEHPDTHKEFWDEFDHDPFYAEVYLSFTNSDLQFHPVLYILAILGLLTLIVLHFRRIKHAKESI